MKKSGTAKSGDCGGPVCITINLPLNKGIVGASLHRSQSTTKSGDCGGASLHHHQFTTKSGDCGGQLALP